MNMPNGEAQKTLTLLHHHVSSDDLPRLASHPDVQGQNYPLAVVHGVIDHQGDAMHAVRYKLPEGAAVGKTEIHLAPDAAEAFLGYYRDRFVTPCTTEGHCHGLVAHVLGWDHWTAGMPAKRPVASDQLESGKAYAVVPVGKNEFGNRYQMTHSMLGTADPSLNVSMLGDDLPVAVMDNATAQKMYGGVIHESYNANHQAQRRHYTWDNLKYSVGKVIGKKSA